MREGQASYTAGMVALGRAAAHGRIDVPLFSDPFAERFLPAHQKALLDRLGKAPRTLRERVFREYLKQLAVGMALRTVVIDEGVRQGLQGCHQLVILGAGLDARAWRMTELKDVTVFEVDHPATQAFKRERTQGLTPLAAEVRFVPVNFERDSLDARLADAGHDSTRPTIWIWEGVVMYLRLPDIEASLRVIAQRSAAGSRLIVNYGTSSVTRRVMGFLLGFRGEPFRSFLSPEQMAGLLRSHGFQPLSDENGADWHRRHAGSGVRLHHALRSLRVAIAERPAGP